MLLPANNVLFIDYPPYSPLMKSLAAKPAPKSKSQAPTANAPQKSKAPTLGFRDSRPEAILQRKLQDAANTSPQVMQLQAMQAMADSRASQIPVVQRIKGLKDDKIERTYSEVENGKETNHKVGRFGRKRKTLVEDDIEGAGTTTETGYQVLTLEKGEKKKEWEIMASVLEWDGNTLCTRNNFKLPVSCIESSEHVIHHHQQNKNKKRKKDPELIPHHDQDEEKSVGLYFGKTKLVKIPNSKRRKRTTVNTYVANVSTDDIDNTGSGWVDYDFKSKPAQIGEGLFVQSKTNGTVFHAVAVVGKKGSKLIVLERNAGNTTGNNMYLDKKWLVNVYANEGAFKDSMGESKDWRIGKLKVL